MFYVPGLDWIQDAEIPLTTEIQGVVDQHAKYRLIPLIMVEVS